MRTSIVCATLAALSCATPAALRIAPPSRTVLVMRNHIPGVAPLGLSDEIVLPTDDAGPIVAIDRRPYILRLTAPAPAPRLPTFEGLEVRGLVFVPDAEPRFDLGIER